MLTSDQERALEKFSHDMDCERIMVLRPNSDGSVYLSCPSKQQCRLVMLDGSTPRR